MDNSRPSTSRASARGSLLASGLAALASHGHGDASEARAGTSRSSFSRQSGRYSQARSHRSSRAPSVIRGSVRYGRSGPALDSSGLPYDRVLCIDEDGKDRTPKPLVAARAHAGDAGLPGSAGWGGSDAMGSLTSGAGALGEGRIGSERASMLGFAPLLGSSGLPTDRSFLTNSEAIEPSREPSMDGSALPAGTATASALPSIAHVAGASGSPPLRDLTAAAAAAVARQSHAGQAPQLIASVLDVGRPEKEIAHEQNGQLPREQQHAAQQQARQRCKSTQCPAPIQAARGTQVLPWELRSTCVGSSDADADAAEGGALTGHQGDPGAGIDVADGLGGDDEEALLAMQHFGEGGRHVSNASLRSSPTPSNGFQSASASRRGSTAGSHRGSVAGLRMSTMHADDYNSSRPSTAMGSRRTTTQAGGDWTTRDSMASGRASMAHNRLDGRGSVMSSASGFYPPASARASVMAGRVGNGTAGGLQGGPTVPQPTAAELAAAAARKQKAEQERALARMPQLVQRLQMAEKAVLVNTQHAKLAQYHSVQFCFEKAVGVPGDSGSAQADAEEAEAAGLGSGIHQAESNQPVALSPGPSGSEARERSTSGAVDATTTATVAPAGECASRNSEARSAAPASHASLAPTPPASSRQQQAELRLLWTWHSELRGELPVSCMAFNRAAPGLVAVGYGRLEFAVPQAGAGAEGGLVAVWSLANPAHPIWHAATPCGVSALDWSGKAPGTLAVGFFDGSIALYDVRSSSSSGSRRASHSLCSSAGGAGDRSHAAGPTPLAVAPPAGAAGTTGGHAEPVWRLRYVPKASDQGEEMLVSISSDGRVLEWKHAQGLERTELLHLKRQHGGTASRGVQGGGKETQAGTEGYLGRAAGGTCFDFCPADPRAYLVGTEEGRVYRCTTAFSEQYTQSYGGHLGPVYQVCWSPFSPSLFLTASADWSVRLWSEAQPRSLWTFQLPTSKVEVADVAFCPLSATVFASAAGNSLHVWDVEHSVLAPRAVATRFGARLTAVAFSQAAPVVVVGADDGVVTVYSLARIVGSGPEGGPEWEQEQRQRLEAALRHHTAHAESD